MKVINKDSLFSLLPKLNILLIVSAAILTVSLYSNINRTYEFNDLAAKKRSARPLELIVKGEATSSFPLFQEDIFKKKFLFNQSTTKKAAPEKKVYILLGVSMGKKNIAVIRDIKASKDYYGSIGDPVGDYQVKEILRDKVILESAEGILEISR